MPEPTPNALMMLVPAAVTLAAAVDPVDDETLLTIWWLLARVCLDDEINLYFKLRRCPPR